MCPCSLTLNIVRLLICCQLNKNHIVVLKCISLNTQEVEHLCILKILGNFSSVKCCSCLLEIFLLGCFCLFKLIGRTSLCILYTNPLLTVCFIKVL